MKSIIAWSALLLASQTSAAANPEEVLGSVSEAALPVTGRYIVQFSEAGSLKYRKRDGSPVSYKVTSFQ